MGKGINSETPPECTEHPPYVTVYVAAGGWQSVCVHWNIEDGYEEPWSTGQGPYRTRTDAVTEAKEWAQGWGIEVRIPDMKPGEKEEADGLLTTLKSIGLDVTVLDRNPAN